MKGKIILSKIVPVLAGLIFDDQGRILIAKRSEHLKHGGKWEFPGGKLEPGESPEQCLKREIKEEMGIAIEVLIPFHLVNYEYPEETILLIGYLGRFLGGQWCLTDHAQALWVKIPELKNYAFSQADEFMVQKLFEWKNDFPKGKIDVLTVKNLKKLKSKRK